MKTIRTIVVSAALTFPTWMSGSWSAVIDGVSMEEHWTSSDGGVMLGLHRDVGRKTSFEFLRIEKDKDGAIVYQAQPGGRPATPFTLKSNDGTRATFENMKHDFPQRVIYWRKGEQLCARVEGTINDKAQAEEWCWNRMK
jgi:hypothetical protein